MKKLTKRTLVLALTAVMVATMSLAGCASNQDSTSSNQSIAGNSSVAGNTAVDETITFPLSEQKTFKLAAMYFEGQTPKMSEAGFFVDFEKHTNVKIEWVDIPNDAKVEKMNLMLAGGDLPDAIYGQWTIEEAIINTYKSQGYFVPLTDEMLNKYAPDYVKFLSYDPAWEKSVAFPDGNVYSLFKAELSPYTGTVNDSLNINRDWLKKLGLEEPKTTEELKEVLLAFKNGGDLNGDGKANEIPFTFRATVPHHQSALASFMGIFGTPDDAYTHINVSDDGKITFAPQSEDYKRGIEYVRSLYELGLIDIEAFTQDANTFDAKLKTATPIAGFYIGAANNTVNAATGRAPGEEIFVNIPPIKETSTSKDAIWIPRIMPVNQSISFTITSACKDPNTLLAWANEQYKPEWARQATFGKVGEHYEDLGNNIFRPFRFPDDPEKQKAATAAKNQYVAYSNISGYTPDSFVIEQNTAVYDMRIINKIYEPFFQPAKNIFPSILSTTDEADELAGLTTDIFSYVQQMQAKWICEGGIEKDWDGYIKKLNDMKLSRYIEIRQAQLDRYNAQ